MHFLKKDEAPETHIPWLGWESYHLGGVGGSGRVKLTNYHQKKLGIIVFILYCDSANFITMSHSTCDVQTMPKCIS